MSNKAQAAAPRKLQKYKARIAWLVAWVLIKLGILPSIWLNYVCNISLISVNIEWFLSHDAYFSKIPSHIHDRYSWAPLKFSPILDNTPSSTSTIKKARRSKSRLHYNEIRIVGSSAKRAHIYRDTQFSFSAILVYY